MRKEDSFDCPKCKDQKHIFENGVYRRCSCLKEAVLNIELAKAGIDFPSKDLTFSTIVKKYPMANETAVEAARIAVNRLKVKKEFPSRSLCFQGRGAAKEHLAKTVLKEAVEGGWRVFYTTMEALISRHFDKIEHLSLAPEFKKYEVFCVHFGGGEQTPNVTSSFVKELVRLSFDRRTYLMFTTSIRSSDFLTRYGQDFLELFTEDAQSTDLDKILYLPTEA